MKDSTGEASSRKNLERQAEIWQQIKGERNYTERT